MKKIGAQVLQTKRVPIGNFEVVHIEPSDERQDFKGWDLSELPNGTRYDIWYFLDLGGLLCNHTLTITDYTRSRRTFRSYAKIIRSGNFVSALIFIPKRK